MSVGMFKQIACISLAALLLPCPSLGELFDLDDAVPWLRTGGSEIAFDAGWDAFVVVDSSCVRVNARGVQAKPSHWTPRTAGALGGPWSSRACMPGAGGGLCETGTGVVFPARSRGSPPLYNAGSAWGGLACSRASDGRWLDPEYGYDVSACDVLDAGGDVAFCGRTLFFGRSALPDASYWAMCLISVFVVRSLSYLVVRKVSDSSPPDRAPGKTVWGDALTMAACLAVLPLALAPDGDAWFVTEEESFFFVVACAYMGVYAALFAIYAWAEGDGDPPVYNLIAATLQVVASRLYLSAETPYNPVILWAIGTRALVKLRSAKIARLRVALSALADSILLSLMCVLGFAHSPYYLVAIFTLSMATSDTLSTGRL